VSQATISYGAIKEIGFTSDGCLLHSDLVSGDCGRLYDSMKDSKLMFTFRHLNFERMGVASCTELYSGTGCDHSQ